MTQSLIDLKPSDWVELRRVLGEHLPHMAVWAFGSRTKGTAKPYSDLDLALITHLPMTLEEMADIRDAFGQSDMTVKVDLLDWAATDPRFQALIEQEKVVIQAG